MGIRTHLAGGSLVVAAMVSLAFAAPADEFPDFKKVSDGYEKVVSTADGKASLYTVYVDKKKNQMLVELPRNYEQQKYLIAVTQASGGVFAGLQGPERYVYWKRYDKRLALMTPQIETRATGEDHAKSSVKRLFTDRVLIDVPIVAMGPGGGPVIDGDDLLVKQASSFMGGGGRAGGGGAVNARLASIAKAKAFPNNVELAFEAPGPGGTLTTFHYSISLVPDKTDYKPREADERVGYFTTVYRDLSKYKQQEKWVRYIDRWHLEKRDPKLAVSPPKEPIVFYLEHTIPVRYRRWVRRGVEYWNEAFRAVGFEGAIEVRYQDAATGAHMEKDPEDVRFSFIRWLNNDISTAIGPHRAHPLTGQILDADVVLTDGWIRAYWGWYSEQMPELAVESFTPETLAWLEDNPDWDPRILMAAPERRQEILTERARRKAAGEQPALADASSDPAVRENTLLAEMTGWLADDDRICLAAHGLAFDMAFQRLNMEALDLINLQEVDTAGKSDTLDGIPEWFVGPLLAELVAHEVGHTLGLRHNFKASSIYTLDQINSSEWKGSKPLAGSVMDYLPPNFNMESGEIQGDFTMIGVGPYDKWAIEYGYTLDDPAKVLERVAEPELAYLTDDDTSGPDPLARRYDFADPHAYAENQMRLVAHHRDRILDKFVKEGESWSRARDGYQVTLGMQTRTLSMMANWIGGAHVNRDRKGDPDGRPPVVVVDADGQRAALDFVIDNALNDEAFGLTPDLLRHMTVDKWSDRSPGDRGDPTWPVHDRVMGVQASVLTMILNPSTLARIHDNEFRTEAGDDALTLPEVMDKVVGAVFHELDTDLDGATYTNRDPMISSLRRNLQANTIDRLIALAMGDNRMPRPIRTLAMHHLRNLQGRVGEIAKKADSGQIDDYTVAHLQDLNDRIEKAIEAVYVKQY